MQYTLFFLIPQYSAVWLAWSVTGICPYASLRRYFSLSRATVITWLSLHSFGSSLLQSWCKLLQLCLFTLIHRAVCKKTSFSRISLCSESVVSGILSSCMTFKNKCLSLLGGLWHPWCTPCPTYSVCPAQPTSLSCINLFIGINSSALTFILDLFEGTTVRPQGLAL